jgi:hypothetical protein
MADEIEEPEFEDPDDRPWDEEKWEAYMRQSDLRAARFGELLETVMDEPDRHRIIAREMGWDWLTEALDERDAARARGETVDDEGDDELGVSLEAPDPAPAAEGAKDSGAQGEMDIDWDDDDDDFDFDDGPDEEPEDPAVAGARRRRRLRDEVPAYKLAFEVGMKVHQALKPYSTESARGEEFDERLGKAAIGCHIAAAKLAGGHAMGYDEDVLCGHIVNCKRGLAGAQEAEEALLELKEDRALPAELVDSLLPDVRAVIEAMKARIEELRARVWW